MDTKDTDIKQEPTAPGAEGNDGGFPQNNPAECGICFTLFDDIERRPRTLPCGHTFCTSCLIVLLETKNLTCPSCRVKHQTTTINKIPISYTIEEILRQQKQMLRHNEALASLMPSKNANTTEGLLPSNEDTTSSKEPGTPAGDTFTTIKPSLKNFLEEQSTSIDSAVDDREENMGQLELYRTHLAKWKQQHDQQMEKMKQLETLNKTISNDLEQEDCRVNNLIGKGREIVEQLKATQRRIQDITKEEEVGQVINQAFHYIDENTDWKKKYQELFPDVKTVTTSKKIRDVTKKALMMVDDEAGATEQTNQLIDFTLPLLDKVQILVNDQIHVCC
ncbi:hypothetical protein Pmani_015017 [Petrolisthes manimaculis]|uniref:RING-type domain-containing protein n=1 Tax=Petrolisthes manimaculis TaxID=1843537 RepID=A0AAE1PUC6_9EUCA|nr:hypothetical protein Pmani_015017 [Petrolisthes manimaculis]